MPVRRFLGSFVVAVLAGMTCLAPVCDLWCHSGCLGPGALSPSPPCHGHERDSTPTPRGHHHSPATAPEQQCGGPNSALVAARGAGDGQRRLLGLSAEVEAGVIQQCSATGAEQAAFLARLHPGLRAKLDPGETEALAYLSGHGITEMSLVTGDGAAIAAAHALGFSEQLLSLEGAYQRVGHTKRLRVDMTEQKFREQLLRATILVAQGRALA